MQSMQDYTAEIFNLQSDSAGTFVDAPMQVMQCSQSQASGG